MNNTFLFNTILRIARILICTIALVFTAGCVKNIVNTPQSPVFMWKIAHNKAVVYLLGSVHAAEKSMYPLDNRIEKAFNRSDILVLEIDSSDTSKVAAAVNRYAMYPEGSSLKDDVGEELFNEYVKQAASYSFLASLSVQSFRPFMAASILLVLKMHNNGIDPSLGIDNYFQQKARKRKIPILELESADMQMQLLAELPLEYKKEFFKQSLVAEKQIVQEVRNIFSCWKKGDAESMYSLYRKSHSSPSIMADYLLIGKRNHAMAEKINLYLQNDKTYFVVAGAMHMPGPDGIVSLLKSRGYQVKQQ